MSDGLTAPAARSELVHEPPGRTPRSPWLVVPAQALGIVAGFAVAGYGAGRLWYHLWDQPSGVVSGGQWYTDEAGLRDDFQGVGWYVAIAVLTGLVLGMIAARFCGRAELVTLAAVVAGSVLAAYIMLEVGSHLSPADPHELAKTAKDGTKLKGALLVSSWPPRGAFPFGALLGLALVYGISIGRGPDGGDALSPPSPLSPYAPPPPRG